MSSNRQPEENENLLKSIASTVEIILGRLETTATKDDLKRLATKDDFETLREQVSFLGGQVEDVRDRMATKDDVARVDSRIDALGVKVDRLEVTTTIIRGEVERVNLRLDAIEKALSSRLNHIEAEMSRMRSVLYLLVKDRPEMLRLLGLAPPAAEPESV